MGETERSVLTLFFTNIADQLHWQVFDRHGKVVDVFIPRRRSRTGERSIYGARISVAFTLRGGRDASWKWSKECTEGLDSMGSGRKHRVFESGDSVTGRHFGSHRRAVGVVPKDKVEVLESCVVAWCKGGLRGRVLVEEL
ncbi:hypothetical protein V6N13_125991 [Hibiscus sabdariffa]